MSWRDIPGWPYEASSDGDIRNKRTGRILRPDESKGYLRVTLSFGGISQRFQINRLVCEAFHGPAPSEQDQARHWNGNSLDNRESNLSWGTRSDNEQDKRRHGTYQSGEGNPFSILTKHQVDAIRRSHAANLEMRKAAGFKKVEFRLIPTLALEHGVTVPCIKGVIANRNWPT